MKAILVDLVYLFLFLTFANHKSIPSIQKLYSTKNLLKRIETFLKSEKDFAKIINKKSNSNNRIYTSIRNPPITQIVTPFWPHENVTILSGEAYRDFHEITIKRMEGHN